MFLLELDQYCLQLETKEELEIITNLLCVVTGYTTQVQLAQALNVRQSCISDAKRRSCIPLNWLYKALEWTIIGTTTYAIEHPKGHGVVPLREDGSSYHYPSGDDDVELKMLCEISSRTTVDTVLIRYIPELVHCLKLVVLF